MTVATGVITTNPAVIYGVHFLEHSGPSPLPWCLTGEKQLPEYRVPYSSCSVSLSVDILKCHSAPVQRVTGTQPSVSQYLLLQ